MTAVVAVAAGLLVVAGLLGLIAGLQRRERPTTVNRSGSLLATWVRLTRRPAGRAGRRRDLVLVGGALAGVAIAATSGWVIAVALVPALALGLPYLLVVPRPREIELLEALDRWIRSLSATLTTGKSITDAIRISRRTAPPVLADEVSTLVVRLNNRWETREALMRFADALDSPDSDAVVAALILAANRGANGASITLTALADSIQSQLKGRRAIEIERSKPYVVVRQVTVISMATLGLVYLVQPSYFDSYRTTVGQLVLSVLVFLYFASLVFMRRKARSPDRPRLLVERPR